jgi:hydroxymethylpyrimidine/phosphomethylpyrimidine kinase
MRVPSADARPSVLTVAGSDSGGGAGIQADLKTIEAHGAFGTSVVTSVTAQNTRGVASVHPVPTASVAAQYDAVVSDFDVRAAKTGMLGTAETVETVTRLIEDASFPVVVDPVMVATSGDRLLDRDAERAYEDLVAAATVVTPNADEAAALTGVEPTDEDSAREAGARLVEMGADAALVTGGHVPGEEVVDRLVTREGETAFAHPRVDTGATHGSGCALSSAVAANLARGGGLDAVAEEPSAGRRPSLVDAVAASVSFLERAVRYPLDVGEGPGAVHHLVEVRNRAARGDVVEAVEGVVDELVAAGARELVSDAGLDVVGATPYAERPDELASVEVGVARTRSGVRPNRDARAGSSARLGRVLLAAREADPSLRFAANCRFDGDAEAALDSLGWPVARAASTGDDRWAEVLRPSVGTASPRVRTEPNWTETPRAVVEKGTDGREPLAYVLAPDAETLAGRLTSLAAALSER